MENSFISSSKDEDDNNFREKIGSISSSNQLRINSGKNNSLLKKSQIGGDNKFVGLFKPKKEDCIFKFGEDKPAQAKEDTTKSKKTNNINLPDIKSKQTMKNATGGGEGLKITLHITDIEKFNFKPNQEQVVEDIEARLVTVGNKSGKQNNKNNNKTNGNAKDKNDKNKNKNDPKGKLKLKDNKKNEVSNQFENSKRGVSISKIMGQSAISKGDGSKIIKAINETEFETEEANNILEMNNKLDIYINSKSKNKVLNNTVENCEIENKIYSKLKEFSKKFDINNLMDKKTKEENERFELVEKDYIDKIRDENEIIQKSINEINDKLKDLKFKKFKETGEFNCKKHMYQKEEKTRKDNTQEIQMLYKENQYLNSQNITLKEELTGAHVDKNSLLNAISTMLKEYNINIYNEFVNKYRTYNNETYLTFNQQSEEEKVEVYLGKINTIENEIENEKNKKGNANQKNLDSQRNELNELLKLS